MEPFQIINRNKIFEGRIFDLSQDLVSLPNGKEHLYDTILHPGGAAILPVDAEDNVYLVKQYRPAAEQFLLEIPAGRIEPGEDPREGVIRELREEVGLYAETVEKLTGVYSTAGLCSEVLHLYYAEGLSSGEQDLDEDEYIEIVKMPLAELTDMCLRGEIIDAKTVVAVTLYVLNRQKSKETK